MAFQITKAVIPAAGLGTRFLPATKAMPKEMLPVVDKPAIQYVVEEAVAAGLTDVLMITGRNKSALENHFDRVGELEAALERKGDTVRLQKVNYSTELAARVTRSVLVMRCCGRGCMLVISRLRFFSVMTSLTVVMCCCRGCLRFRWNRMLR